MLLKKIVIFQWHLVCLNPTLIGWLRQPSEMVQKYNLSRQQETGDKVDGLTSFPFIGMNKQNYMIGHAVLFPSPHPHANPLILNKHSADHPSLNLFFSLPSEYFTGNNEEVHSPKTFISFLVHHFYYFSNPECGGQGKYNLPPQASILVRTVDQGEVIAYLLWLMWFGCRYCQIQLLFLDCPVFFLFNILINSSHVSLTCHLLEASGAMWKYLKHEFTFLRTAPHFHL